MRNKEIFSFALDPFLVRVIKEIAGAEGCSASATVQQLLDYGIMVYRAQMPNIEGVQEDGN